MSQNVRIVNLKKYSNSLLFEKRKKNFEMKKRELLYSKKKNNSKIKSAFLSKKETKNSFCNILPRTSASLIPDLTSQSVPDIKCLENSLIKINNIKNDLSLNIAKKCIYNIVIPLFIDINKNEKSMILRFDSKKNSELFLSKIKEKNYEDIKDILEPSKEGNNDISIDELLEKERKEYLDNVKMKIEKYKEKKENSKNCKENGKNE